MTFWQTIRRFFAAAWFADVAWPLRLVRGGLAFFLVFGLVMAAVWVGFGRDAEKQVEDLGEGLISLVAIVLVPLLLIGLIVFPFHRWARRKAMTAMTPGPDHQKARRNFDS